MKLDFSQKNIKTVLIALAVILLITVAALAVKINREMKNYQTRKQTLPEEKQKTLMESISSSNPQSYQATVEKEIINNVSASASKDESKKDNPVTPQVSQDIIDSISAK